MIFFKELIVLIYSISKSRYLYKVHEGGIIVVLIRRPLLNVYFESIPRIIFYYKKIVALVENSKKEIFISSAIFDVN